MADLQTEPTTRVLCTCGHRRTNHRGPVGPQGERGQCMTSKGGVGCGCTAYEKAEEESAK